VSLDEEWVAELRDQHMDFLGKLGIKKIRSVLESEH
jgi:hypothetical protein